MASSDVLNRLHPFIAATVVLSLLDALFTIGALTPYWPLPAWSGFTYLWFGSPLILLAIWVWARGTDGPGARWLWVAAPFAFSAWIVLVFGFVFVAVFCTLGSCDL